MIEAEYPWFEQKRKVMNETFDELTKNMAQSTTRRGALKKFGLGLASLALAWLGLANKAEAKPKTPICDCSGLVDSWGCDPRDRKCIEFCAPHCS